MVCMLCTLYSGLSPVFSSGSALSTTGVASAGGVSLVGGAASFSLSTAAMLPLGVAAGCDVATVVAAAVTAGCGVSDCCAGG